MSEADAASGGRSRPKPEPIFFEARRCDGPGRRAGGLYDRARGARDSHCPQRWGPTDRRPSDAPAPLAGAS
jgi:hypothetical protein